MFRVGIDVGGTNTDAVLLRNKEVIVFSKTSTTPDVSAGVQNALSDLLNQAAEIMPDRQQLAQVNIGTTHFINAVIQRKNLVRVAVIRLCGPTTSSLPPLCTFPKDLASLIYGPVLFAEGGYNFDGSVITSLDKSQISDFVKKCLQMGIQNFVVVGVFSAVKQDQEIMVADIIKAIEPKSSVTLSHTIGSVGLIDRENMSILNESLRPLCQNILHSFKQVLFSLKLSNCSLFFTQNDGTVLDLDSCYRFPVKTFSSGATNSMRGASFLCNVPNLIVLDIGGTSSDAGLIINSFPKPASAHVTIGGVSTSFSMPEVKSIGLGGGSIIKVNKSKSNFQVMAESVALQLKEKSQIFGGNVLTMTDYAVVKGLLQLGDKDKVQDLDSSAIQQISTQIEKKLGDLINEVRISSEPIPVYIVGGGECIVAGLKELAGLPIIETPSKYKVVANAIGAALSEISYTYDSIVDVSDRQQVLASIQQECKDQISNLGGQLDTIRMVEISEVELPYILGCNARIVAKAVGEIDFDNQKRVPTSLKELEFRRDEASSMSLKCENFDDHLVICTDICPSIPEINNGSWTLSNYDIHCISVGCGVLGCGGGGNPNLLKLMLLKLMQSTGKRPVITSAKHLLSTGMSPKAKVIDVAEMGSPTILNEKITQNLVYENIVKGMCLAINGLEDGVKLSKQNLSKMDILKEENLTIAALMSDEIGGGNGLASLLAAVELDLPVIDCDGMGRAFPELQMLYQFIMGKEPLPAVMVNDQGEALVRTEGIASPKELENVFRDECLKGGCSSGVSMCPLDLDEVDKFTVLHSFSRAWQIGNAILKAKSDKTDDPISALCKAVNGQVLFSGKVTDVLKRIEGGWSKGYVTIESDVTEEDGTSGLVFIELQNEYLKLSKKKTAKSEEEIVLATVPDLITLIDKNNFEPVMTDEVRFGLQVEVIVIPSPSEMTTAASLEVVGPQAFGFNHHYESKISYVALPSLV